MLNSFRIAFTIGIIIQFNSISSFPTKVIKSNHNLFQMTQESNSNSNSNLNSKSRSTLSMKGSMSSTCNDLSERIVSLLNDKKNLRNNQLFIGMGGGPGAGKSTIAEGVRDRVNELLQDENAAIVLPMDGFHYSRLELQELATKEQNYESLLARRGAPWTFNAKACIDSFYNARLNGEASLPIYSRQKSDPVLDGVILKKKNRVVLLEGNYLLAYDDDEYGWKGMNLTDIPIFDETWFVECVSMEEQRERLIARHLETWTDEKSKLFGASGREGAARKADSNDVLNAEWITKVSRKHADLIVINL